jgi:hypothetical protein
VPKHKKSTVVVSRGIDDTARFLVWQAGGSAAKAHEAVTRALDEQIPIRTKRTLETNRLLLIADIIQREDGCSENKAFERVARLHLKGSKARTNMVRNLSRKLDGKSLAEVARSLPLYGQVGFKMVEKFGQ